MGYLLIFTTMFIYGCRCEADPSALAKYVVALVKKDKTLAELKDSCVDQLDVFLQASKSVRHILFDRTYRGQKIHMTACKYE